MTALLFDSACVHVQHRGVVVISNSVPRKLVLKQFESHLPFTACCPLDLAQEVAQGSFPEFPARKISCTFINDGPLAWSRWCSHSGELDIHLHNVLNHSDTPALVLQFLIKHELLHLKVRPFVIEDETHWHHDQFTAREKQLSPERLLVWTWLYVALGEHLRVRPQAERIDVASTWKATWHLPRPDIAAAVKMRNKFRRPAPRYM